MIQKKPTKTLFKRSSRSGLKQTVCVWEPDLTSIQPDYRAGSGGLSLNSFSTQMCFAFWDVAD